MSPIQTPSSRSFRGFTLVELLISVLVIGILAAVVYPNLSSYLRKGRRAEAYNALNAIQQAQERHRANKASYATSITNIVTAGGLGLSGTSSSGLYTMSLGGVTDTGYSVIATAVSGKSQSNDAPCQQLRVRMASGQLFYGSANGDGSFSESATNPCWSR